MITKSIPKTVMEGVREILKSIPEDISRRLEETSLNFTQNTFGACKYLIDEITVNWKKNEGITIMVHISVSSKVIGECEDTGDHFITLTRNTLKYERRGPIVISPGILDELRSP